MTQTRILCGNVKMCSSIAVACAFRLSSLDAGVLSFSNSTQQAGITHLHFHADAAFGKELSWMAGGAVAEDFDRDGHVDVYMLQAAGSGNVLYMNRGDGTFTNASSARGAALSLAGMGACAADYDNDGDVDIAITRLEGRPRILINDGTGHFSQHEEVLNPINPSLMSERSTSPAFGDIDLDGILELVVGRWVSFGQNLAIFRRGTNRLEEYHFRDAAGLDKRVFTPRFADMNGDRFPDLLSVSDFSNTQIYMNEKDGSFRNATLSAVLLSGTNMPAVYGPLTDENGMGSAIGDYDNDGDLDWFISSIRDTNGPPEGNWGISGNRLYQNQGDGRFVDVTTQAGVRDGYWGWGSAFGDLDNDGDLDLYHVNGWADSRTSVAEKYNLTRAVLFENLGDGTFSETAVAAGADDDGQGRGVLFFDYDNDGRLDILIANNHALTGIGVLTNRQPTAAVLLRNTGCASNNWLKVSLIGAAPLHHDGIGSRVYVRTGSVTQMRELHASTGFLAQGPARIAHFGLGTNETVSEVRVEWVNGDDVSVYGVAANQHLALTGPRGQFSARAVRPGALVDASVAAHDGSAVVWHVNGQAAQAPVSIAFDAPGEHTFTLTEYNANTSAVVRVDTMRVRVIPESVFSMISRESGDRWHVSWSVFSDYSFSLQSRPHLAGGDWQDVEGPLTSRTARIVSSSISNLNDGAFLRIRSIRVP